MDRRLMLVCIAVLAACNGSASLDETTSDAGDGSLDDGSRRDGSRDASADVPVGTTPFGARCTTGADCAGGVCVTTSTDERRCSAACEETSECPDGWACEPTEEGEFTELACTCHAAAEVCDGRDDDCDGTIDEDVAQCCAPGDREACGSSDACAPGMRSCTSAGMWGECEGEVLAGPETCDGLDNDCDASTPDGAHDPRLGESCGSGQALACRSGELECRPSIATEICDGLDNDDDDATADGSAEPTLGSPCSALDCTGRYCGGATGCVDGSLVCERTEFPPRVLRSETVAVATLTERTTVKVVLIIDNSESMAEEQSRMADGFRAMLASLDVPNLELEFYLYTMDSLYAYRGRKHTTTARQEYEWDSDGALHPAAPPPPTGHVVNAWAELNPPYNGPTPLRFTSDLTPAERTTRTDALLAAIRAIGTTGPDEEAGLCTMSQVIVGRGPNKVLLEGDHVAFILISDADDPGTFGTQCMGRSETRADWDPDATWELTTRELADTSNYFMRELAYSYTYATTFVDPETGAIREGRGGEFVVDLPAEDYPPGVSCAMSHIACPAALAARFEARAGHPLLDCWLDCVGGYVRVFEDDDYDLSHDYCTEPYTIDGVTYANLEDDAARAGVPYVSGSCLSRHRRQIGQWDYTQLASFGAHEILPPYTEGRTAFDAAPRLLEALPSYFGTDRYFVSAIIHHSSVSDAGCAATSEGVGTRYASFIDSLGARGFKQSICASDYSASTARLTDFVEGAVERTFTLTLGMNEAVGRVFVVHADGSETEVPMGQSFARGGEVSIDASIPLVAGDHLRVEIVEG